MTLERKSASLYAVKILSYYSKGGGDIDGCKRTSTGARLGRETMWDWQIGARCGLAPEAFD